jgi:hypothetical protein
VVTITPSEVNIVLRIARTLAFSDSHPFSRKNISPPTKMQNQVHSLES